MSEEQAASAGMIRRGTTSDTRDDVSTFEFFNAKLEAVDRRLEALITFQRELVATRFDASQNAIYKAEQSNEKRFESVNEFRAQLKDQAATFVPREQIDQSLREMHERLDRMREDYISREIALTAAMNTQSERLSNVEGRMIAYAGAVGVIVTIVSVGSNFILHH